MKKYLVSFLIMGLVTILFLQLNQHPSSAYENRLALYAGGTATTSTTNTGTNPTPTPTPQRGVCCFPNGTCEPTLPTVCTIYNGTYIIGGSCIPNPCTTPTPTPEPQGACCYPPSNDCTVGTQNTCQQHQGSYQGNGTKCDPNPCVKATATPTPTATPDCANCVGDACFNEYCKPCPSCAATPTATPSATATPKPTATPVPFNCSLCGTQGYPCTENPCESQCQDQCFGGNKNVL